MDNKKGGILMSDVFITARVPLSLVKGCRLYYDCPPSSDSFQADEFFRKHRGRYATFIEYSEKLIGVLDHQGRLPGRYIDKRRIKVQFDGEEPRELNICHFVVMDDKINARLVHTGDIGATHQRIGDLPHSILFYPEDAVRFIKKPEKYVTDDPRLVRAVFTEKPFVEGSIPRYEVLETEAECLERMKTLQEVSEKKPEGSRHEVNVNYWNTSGEDLELVKRGNVWALYDDSKLFFDSIEDELKFWARTGISYFASDPNRDLRTITGNLRSFNGRTFEDAWMLFASGEADMIVARENVFRSNAPNTHNVRKLHDCFEKHRSRVRSLTERVWAPRINKSMTA